MPPLKENTLPKNPLDIDMSNIDLGNLDMEGTLEEARGTCALIGTDEIKQTFEDIREKGISEFFQFSKDTKNQIQELLAEIEEIKKESGDNLVKKDPKLAVFERQKDDIDETTLEFLGNDKNIKIVFEKIQTGGTLTEKEQSFADLMGDHNNNLDALFTGYNTRIQESVHGEKKMGSYMAIYAIVDNPEQLAEYYQDIAEIEIKKLESQLGKNGNDSEIQEKIDFYNTKVKRAKVFQTAKGQELAGKILRGENISEELDQLVEAEKNGSNNTDREDISLNVKEAQAKESFRTPDGKSIEGVTGEELAKMNNDESYRENYINAYTWFEDNNLLGVWKYRKDIKNATNTINLNLESSSFTEGKLTLFGNKLIKIANTILEEQYNGDVPEDKKLIENADTLNGVEAELRKFTGAGSDITNHRTHGFNGTDKIIHGLEKMGIVGGTYFHTMKLTEMMEETNNIV